MRRRSGRRLEARARGRETGAARLGNPMCWVDEFSGSEEHELGRAWNALNDALNLPGCAVQARTIQTITSNVQSVNTLASILRETFPKEYERMVEEFAAWHLPDELRKEWFRRHPVLAPVRLGTLTLALFIFVRSLQDAAYSALLESDGKQKSSDGTSMHTGLERPRSSTRRLLEARIPGYLKWFTAFRRPRNDIRQAMYVS